MRIVVDLPGVTARELAEGFGVELPEEGYLIGHRRVDPLPFEESNLDTKFQYALRWINPSMSEGRIALYLTEEDFDLLAAGIVAEVERKVQDV